MSNISNIFPEYIMKYGATGVLFAWLFVTNSRLSDVEQRLYNCLETRVRVAQPYTQSPTTVNNRPELLAVLTREVKVRTNTKQK